MSTMNTITCLMSLGRQISRQRRLISVTRSLYSTDIRARSLVENVSDDNGFSACQSRIQNGILKASRIDYIQRRYIKKSKKKSKGKDEEKVESDDEDEDESDLEIDDGSLALGYNEVEVECTNMRLDVAGKTALGVQRRRIDSAFLEDRIRVNGERVTKKSTTLMEKDVIDLVLGRNKDNPEHLDVIRADLFSVPDVRTSKDRCRFKVRRYHRLTIPNYIEHPYESMLESPDEVDRR
ncbi:uncharacterized protein LOC141848917 [Brevipalpus obovatus]|uniref:uncharacterized protein LOC141848917 n=1 Tax=Brevipalpus obovatus TaxID=246614 RepID=UPI003D9E9A63